MSKSTDEVRLDDVVGIVAVQLGRREISPDDRIIEDLGAESLDVVNIVAAVEDRYRIRIEEQELPDLRTVRDLHGCARAKVEERSDSAGD
ncbi:MAG: phosphopantetheine-binding protein [Acidobacteriota bacterium]